MAVYDIIVVTKCVLCFICNLFYNRGITKEVPNMDYKTQFIKNLKDYRKQNNLTQDDLAEIVIDADVVNGKKEPIEVKSEAKKAA